MKPSLCLFAILSLLMLNGCSSVNKPASASFASVVIANHNVENIRAMATTVFEEAGYETYETLGGDLVFQKEGTRKQQLAHGGFLDDSPVCERVRTEIVSVQGGERLQCKVYFVRDAGNEFFDEEKRLANFRSGPYQKLLDKVAEKLK